MREIQFLAGDFGKSTISVPTIAVSDDRVDRRLVALVFCRGHADGQARASGPGRDRRIREDDAGGEAGGRRRRKREAGIRCDRRKPLIEKKPEVVALARSLARRRKRPMSLRQISAELEAAGHLTSNGKPYAAAAIARMIE